MYCIIETVKNKGGSIVYISSSSAVDGNEGRSAYASAKAAIIAQAKVLGGGSSVNGMVYMRGKPSEYQKWVEETGDDRRGRQSLIETYKRLENNQRLSGGFHGSDGAIKVSDPGYVAKGSDLYIKSMQNLGLPYNRDFNDGEQYGVGLMQYTIGDGKRSDTVSTLLKTLLNKIKNG